MTDPVPDVLDTIRGILSAGPARRIVDGVDVWDLSVGPWWTPGADHREPEEAKERILAAVWRLPGELFLVPPESPPDELEPWVRRDGSGAWRVNRERPASDLYARGLREGNWMLYAAPGAWRPPAPSAFKTAPHALVAAMTATKVVLLIDSFHDDTEWRVAVAAPA